jgi:hypothetical protein
MNAPLPPPSTTSSYPNFPQEEGHDPNAFIPENQDQISIIPRSIGINDFYPPSAPAPVPDLNNVSIGTEVEGERLDGEAGKVGGAFMELIWPGWPPRLPTPGELASSSHLRPSSCPCSMDPLVQASELTC